jgi:hypothetical protein
LVTTCQFTISRVPSNSFPCSASILDNLLVADPEGDDDGELEDWPPENFESIQGRAGLYAKDDIVQRYR